MRPVPNAKKSTFIPAKKFVTVNWEAKKQPVQNAASIVLNPDQEMPFGG
jgi:hypothetical protein